MEVEQSRLSTWKEKVEAKEAKESIMIFAASSHLHLARRPMSCLVRHVQNGTNDTSMLPGLVMRGERMSLAASALHVSS